MNANDAIEAQFYRNQEALSFLESASVLFSRCTDYNSTFDQVAQLLVKNLASWCVIDLLSESGQIERVKVHHRDPNLARLTKDVIERFPAKPTARRGVYRVIETGKPIYIPQLTKESWAERADSPEHLQIMMQLGSTSYLCIPLISRGKTLGSIMLLSGERTFDELDLRTTEQFSRGLALVIDNLHMMSSMQSALKVRNEFLNNLSHELRTPANIIGGWLNLMKSEKLDEVSLRQAAEAIEHSFETQSKLINDLIDISRIVSGKFSITREIVDLVEILNTAIKSLSPKAAHKRISIHTFTENDAHYLFGDASYLEKMFSQLLSNAIKFTPEDGTIFINLEATEDKISFTIKDTGVGLSGSFILHAFDAFRQEDSTTTRSYDGLGLGLTIAKNIVNLHGGEVTLTSPGRNLGTQVSVVFPKLKRNPIPQVNKTEEQGRSPHELALLGVKVLLVDDVEEMRSLLTRLIRKSGAEVYVSDSAKDAFEKIQFIRPDILISDIGMPGEDGYSLIKRIRNLDVTNGGHTSAIALSAYLSDEEKTFALNSGFDCHLSKPVSYEALITCLRSMLKK